MAERSPSSEQEGPQGALPQSRAVHEGWGRELPISGSVPAEFLEQWGERKGQLDCVVP